MKLWGYIRAYYRKIWKKLFGVVHLRTDKKKKGVILLSFMTGPFTLAPHERFTDPHPNYWACEEIARLLLERGYDVDAIEWNNSKFLPKKKYVACIDLQQNLERFTPFLGPDCKKIAHIVSSYPEFQTKAEEARIKALEARRGIKMSMKRPEKPSQNAKFADFIEGYGNKTVHATFSQFGKPITQIHVGTRDIYDFPENKNFAKTRTSFLWFGGGGAILKGLDLIIEAFAAMPEYTLTIIGPSAYEKEFSDAFAKELSLPNIKRLPRPKENPDGQVLVEGRNLFEYFNESAATVFMSASEGAGASVVQAMQAALVPIVTPNSGIDERAGGIVIENPTVEKIQKAVRDFAALPPEKIKEMARHTWKFAHENHSREAFTRNYANFLDNVVKL